MSLELRLHGRLNDDIEFFATAAGCRTAHQHYFQQEAEGLRFFADGNQIQLGSEELSQVGNGGSFCEYMFGVEQPLADLSKEGILNRLILLGASYDESNQLVIGLENRDRQSYEQVFFDGHAVENFFFFLGGRPKLSHPQQQEFILRHLGKYLKRTGGLNRQEDTELIASLQKQLPEDCTFYQIRLVNTRNRQFQQEFQRLYYRDRSITEAAQSALHELADNLAIPRYQQERIRIDVMYRHRDNYRIIDEYKKVLVDCHHQGQLNRQQHARLTRLKTLSVRKKIPTPLLSTLDEQLQPNSAQANNEPEYIVLTRQILQGLFIYEEESTPELDKYDLIQLLQAKHLAQANRDHSFEQLLLETGKLCDEQVRDGAPLSILEKFSSVITFFDRYDSTSSLVGQLAFMENFRLNEDLLRSLLGNQQAFNDLQDQLFSRLFFEDILRNTYLGRFGRRKLLLLRQGLRQITAGHSTLQHLLAELQALNEEEQLYAILLTSAKKRIRNQYSRYDTRAEQQQLLTEINDELIVRGLISEQLDPTIFRSVIHDIKKEAVFLHNLLPEIITRQDRTLREDFLTNSGLDRFYVEELERDYFHRNQIDLEHLQQLRNGSHG